MMKELFNQRVRIHQRQLQKYLRYIINDSFVVIMTFLFGGAVVYYTSFLKQLPTPYPLGQVISLLILLFALHIGKLATLLKPADQIFLLPKEAKMARYLQSALLYSLIVPTLSLALILGFLMPFIQVSFASSLNHYPWLLLSLVGLKIAQLQVQRYQCYQLTSKQGRIAYLAWLVSSLVTLAIALWFNHLLGLALAMLVLLGFSWYLKKVQVQMIFWERMIAREQNRLHRVYQFINLFTDVPFIQAKMKRRRYLDGILRYLPKNQQHTFLHLFVRRFLRSDEFSGQTLRLGIVGSICLVSLNDWRFALVLSLLFIYLIAFQLLPLSQQYQYMILAQLYPISRTTQQANFIQSYRSILLSVALVFSLVNLISTPLLYALLIFGANLVFSLLLIYLYAPNRLKKLQNI